MKPHSIDKRYKCCVRVLWLFTRSEIRKKCRETRGLGIAEAQQISAFKSQKRVIIQTEDGHSSMTNGQTSRKLNLFDVTNLVIGGTLGADIYIVASLNSAYLGPASLLVWLVGGTIAIILALNFAEAAALVPRVGRSFAYVREAWGDFSGFMVGCPLDCLDCCTRRHARHVRPLFSQFCPFAEFCSGCDHQDPLCCHYRLHERARR